MCTVDNRKNICYTNFSSRGRVNSLGQCVRPAALFLSSTGFACKFLPLENFGYKFICKPNCVATLGKNGGKGGFLVKNKGI